MSATTAAEDGDDYEVSRELAIEATQALLDAVQAHRDGRMADFLSQIAEARELAGLASEVFDGEFAADHGELRPKRFARIAGQCLAMHDDDDGHLPGLGLNE